MFRWLVVVVRHELPSMFGFGKSVTVSKIIIILFISNFYFYSISVVRVSGCRVRVEFNNI